MKKIILALFLLLLFASASPSQEEYLADPLAEPADFRGIKWQQSLESVSGEMETLYSEDDGDEVSCARKGEDMSFGEAKLDSVEYIFIGGKLSKVAVVAKGEENEDALLDAALDLFGKETVHSNGDYMWRFTNVSVMFSREPQLEQSVLFYQYIGFVRNR
ncbi:MAG: hypothetical protein LBQ36_06365 [Synergistaceae bacterium]|nr:hypothetical protein [Synergistaceae bacterium]